MNIYVVNLKFAGTVQRKKKDGKSYLVVPATALIEGIHEGSQGRILYNEEFLKSQEGNWNGTAIVLNHPADGEQYISVDDERFDEKTRLGFIENSKFEDSKLRFENWFDEKALKKADRKIYNAILKGESVECSTGMIAELSGVSGVWNQEPYDDAIKSAIPDHFAILQNAEGACSVKKGCGCGVNNSAPEVTEEQVSKAEKELSLLRNQLSHSNITSQLQTWLDEKFSTPGGENYDCYVVDVFDDFFIYRKDGKLLRNSYEVDENQVSVTGLSEEVVRVTEYRTLQGQFVGNQDSKGKVDMTQKKECVDKLIAAEASPWKEEHRELLTNASDEQFAAYASLAVTEKKKEQQEEVVVNTSEESKKQLTVQETLDQFAPEIRNYITNALKRDAEVKGKMIADILANESNSLDEATLKTLDHSVLENMVRVANAAKKEEQETEAQANVFDFDALVGLAPTNLVANKKSEGEKLEGLGMPVYDFSDRFGKKAVS